MLIRSLGLGTMFCPGRDAERLDVEDVEDRSGGCLSHGQVIPGVGAPFPRTVAGAARRARLRKDGIGWTRSLSESTSPRTSWDVGVRPSGERFVVSRTETGLEELTDRLRELGVAVVGLEATGGYETVIPFPGPPSRLVR